MEEIKTRVIKLKEYLNVNLVETSDLYCLQGPVMVRARHDDYAISKIYTIKIDICKPLCSMSNSYGIIIPKIYVLSGMDYTYAHIYQNGLLCLDSNFLQYDYLKKNNFDYVEWLKYFFYAFAVEYEYYCEYGLSLGMARSHGKSGLLEALLDYINVPVNKREKLIVTINNCCSIEQIKQELRKTNLVDVETWEINELINEYYYSK